MYNFNFQSRQQSHIKAQQRIKQNKLIAKSIILIRNKKIQRAKMVRYLKEEEPCLVEETQLVLKEEEPCVVEEVCVEETCIIEELKPVVSVHKDLVYFFRAMKFE